ncbi:MAG: hypothetical protein JJ975_07625 [Bacteroidia bacterium]|nr:hypothetical protein [Bacteroidia bacterium]
MKIILSSILSILVCSFSYGQTSNKVRHELGVNASGFASNYLNFSGVVQSNNPYSITYKSLRSKGGLRVGLGGTYIKRDIHPPNQFSSDVVNGTLDFRIGYEWHNLLNDHWSFFYGLDGVIKNVRSEATSRTRLFNGRELVDIDVWSVARREGFGAQAVTGLQWNIKPRISLNTEARVLFVYTEIETGTEFRNVPQEVRDFNPGVDFDAKLNTDFERTLNFLVPLDIYVVFKLNKT